MVHNSTLIAETWGLETEKAGLFLNPAFLMRLRNLLSEIRLTMTSLDLEIALSLSGE
jgi:hypothetical protein